MSCGLRLVGKRRRKECRGVDKTPRGGPRHHARGDPGQLVIPGRFAARDVHQGCNEQAWLHEAHGRQGFVKRLLGYFCRECDKLMGPIAMHSGMFERPQVTLLYERWATTKDITLSKIRIAAWFALSACEGLSHCETRGGKVCDSNVKKRNYKPAERALIWCICKGW